MGRRAAVRARTIMKDTNRLPRPDRRAVLGGLLAGAAATSASLVPAWAKEGDKDPAAAAEIERIEISARPIAHFERGRPDVTRFGALEFRGGMVLSSPAKDFGGWSALVMEPTGKSLLAISDEGYWLSADLLYDGSRPRGLTQAKLAPLLDRDGRPLERKVEQDSEAVALLEGTLQNGTLLIGFERHHRIDRYPIRNGEVQAPTGTLKLPAEAKRMPTNQGIEALAVLKGGPYKSSVVAFAERFTRGSGYHTGWIWVGGGGEPQRIQLQDIAGFNITDAAGLADGSLLVLERYFRWTEGVKMRLRHIPAGEIAPGARITGRTLIEADGAFDIDNMEGLAAHRGAGGETVLSLISDDNFNHFLQRTVFLQFTLHDAD
jgi:hypothetical protein